MPLEINEIAVKMRVGEDLPEPGARMPGGPDIRESVAEMREDIIDECLRRVLRALRDSGER